MLMISKGGNTHRSTQFLMAIPLHPSLNYQFQTQKTNKVDSYAHGKFLFPTAAQV
jgi:hypothetical protein